MEKTRKEAKPNSSDVPKKLKLNKQTIKDLTAKSADQVKGGIPKQTAYHNCE